jgi:hypothetical protein
LGPAEYEADALITGMEYSSTEFHTKSMHDNTRITITILDIIHHHIFYLKHDVSDTRFGFRLQVETTPLGPIYRASIFVETEASPIYWAQLSGFHLKIEIKSSPRNVVLQVKDRTMDNVRNCDSYINIPSSQTYR